jgi:hypothetical protein
MPLIHEALAAIAAEVPSIEKGKTNKQQGFAYRGIDDVYAAIHPLFTKYGVFSVPTVEQERSEERQTKSGGALIYRILTVRYDFYAKDGSCVSAKVIGEGMDSGDKAANKAMAVAHKYALLQVLSIPIDDIEDPDANAHEVKPKQGDRPSAAPEKPPVNENEKAFADLRARMKKAMESGCFSPNEQKGYGAKIKEKGGMLNISVKDYEFIVKSAEAEQEAREKLAS